MKTHLNLKETFLSWRSTASVYSVNTIPDPPRLRFTPVSAWTDGISIDESLYRDTNGLIHLRFS